MNAWLLIVKEMGGFKRSSTLAKELNQYGEVSVSSIRLLPLSSTKDRAHGISHSFTANIGFKLHAHDLSSIQLSDSGRH